MSHVLTDKNIRRVIRKLKHDIKSLAVTPITHLLVPEWTRTERIDRTKYKGKGRPKKDDYVWVKTLDLMQNLTPTKKDAL